MSSKHNRGSLSHLESGIADIYFAYSLQRKVCSQMGEQYSWKTDTEKEKINKEFDGGLRQCGPEYTVCGTAWTEKCCPGLLCQQVQGELLLTVLW